MTRQLKASLPVLRPGPASPQLAAGRGERSKEKGVASNNKGRQGMFWEVWFRIPTGCPEKSDTLGNPKYFLTKR